MHFSSFKKPSLQNLPAFFIKVYSLYDLDMLFFATNCEKNDTNPYKNDLRRSILLYSPVHTSATGTSTSILVPSNSSATNFCTSSL